MNHLFAPFIWLDSFLQRIVDSVAFFLMRRFGVKKSTLYYLVFIPTVIGLLGVVVSCYNLGDYFSAGVYFILVPILVLIKKSNTRIIELSEDRGMDDRPANINLPWVRLFGLSLCVSRVWGLFVKLTFFNYSILFFWGFYTLSMYILNTPNTPPPKEETASDLVHDAG